LPTRLKRPIPLSLLAIRVVQSLALFAPLPLFWARISALSNTYLTLTFFPGFSLLEAQFSYFQKGEFLFLSKLLYSGDGSENFVEQHYFSLL
jgi:hypothetical protein